MQQQRRRHAGLDVVSLKPAGPGGTGETIRHHMGQVPEMIWGKDLGQSANWSVYHKDLNGGSSPEDYRLVLNDLAAEVDTANPWNDTAPTATHFTVGTWFNNNESLFILFASVTGVSKVGSYSGQSAGQSQTITTGFQPRFILVKGRSYSSNWEIYDTVRGWGSGEDKRLELNNNQPQAQTQDVGDPTSTGFTVNGGKSISQSGESYIYYAHA